MEEAITIEELEFIEDWLDPIIKPSVLKSDFYNKRYWNFRVYQEDMLLDKSIRLACSSARGVGKSEVIIGDLLNTIFHPDNYCEEGLLATPNKAHLGVIWDNILSALTNDEFINSLIKRSVRAPNYILEFHTGFKLHGRIASSSKGRNLYGLHCSYFAVDESELFMRKEMEESQGILNKGASVKLFGIPNGIMSSYLYKAFHGKEFDAKYNVNKFQDPTFTEEDHQRIIKIYGGKHTQVYKNQILAIEGAPSHLTFPPTYWKKCLFDLPEYDYLSLNESDLYDKNNNKLFNKLSIPQPFKSTHKIRMSVDCGYSPDPTIILFFTEDDYLFFKVRLDEVAYHKQTEFIHYLAQYYDADEIAGDRGEAGKTIWQMLKDDNLYPDKCYRIVEINFQGTVEVVDEFAKDEEDRAPGEEPKTRKERIKQYSTVLLQRAFEGKKIHIPEQALAVTGEIETSTRHRTPAGNFVFSGIDHHLDCLRIRVISHLIDVEEADDKMVGLEMISI